MRIEVRKALLSDSGVIFVLTKAFHDEAGGQYPFQEARVAVFVREAINSPNMLVVVAGEMPCGFLIATRGVNPLTGELYAEEVAMYVAPEHRSAGLAKEMIDAFETWATKSGCALVKLTAQHSARPEAVARLYRKSGYTAAETAYIRRL